MTTPVQTPSLIDRFATMIDELIHGKAKNPKPNKPLPTIEEEPSWASSSRETIEKVGEVVSPYRRNY